MRLFLFSLLIMISVSAICFPDSVGVINKNGNTYIKHLVEKGETHFAISRKYGINVNKIIELNPDTKDGLVAGIIIIVPVELAEDKIHVVQAGETLFSLYRKYGVSVDQIKKWNDLKTNNISVGQRIIVGKKTIQNDKPEKPIASENSNANIHEVKKGESLFSISLIYEIKWQDIKIYNGLSSNELYEGQKLGIPPTNLNSKEETIKIEANDTINRPETHIVSPGETMYSISKKYQLKSNDIISWNDLLGPEIQIGQELKLKNPEIGKPKEKTKTDPIVVEREEYMKGEPKVKITNVGGHEKVIEKGMVELIEGGTESNRFLGLHKKAPIGTIIQVKNEINGFSVFVRIVGRLPDIGANQDILLKITPRAFEALKGVDKKFKAEISWLP